MIKVNVNLTYRDHLTGNIGATGINSFDISLKDAFNRQEVPITLDAMAESISNSIQSHIKYMVENGNIKHEQLPELEIVAVASFYLLGTTFTASQVYNSKAHADAVRAAPVGSDGIRASIVPHPLDMPQSRKLRENGG